MSRGNKKVAKGPSRFKDAKTGNTYTKMRTGSNSKANKAASVYATANPKKEFYS